MFSHTKEFHDLRAFFEKLYRHERLDREPNESHPRGWFYQDGRVNDLFRAFMHGHQHGKAAQ